MAKKKGQRPEASGMVERDMAAQWSAIFGAEVRAKRVERGLTQQALAKERGYKTHATITQIEMGNVMANFEVAMELARLFQIDLNAVMGIVPTAAPLPASETAWYRDMLMVRLPATVHELWTPGAHQEILTCAVEAMGKAMRDTMTMAAARAAADERPGA